MSEIHVPRPGKQAGLRRYNLVPRIVGQPTNYEWEAADDGAVVQADEAVTLVATLEKKLAHYITCVQVNARQCSEIDALRAEIEQLQRVAEEMQKALKRDAHNMRACKAIIEAWNPEEPSKDELAEILTSTTNNADAALASYAKLKGGK